MRAATKLLFFLDAVWFLGCGRDGREVVHTVLECRAQMPQIEASI